MSFIKRKTLILIFVIVCISVLVLYKNYENESNNQVLVDEEYTELFGNVLTSDGAYSEGFFSELSNFFLKEPEYFVEQLSILNDEDRKIISFNIAHIMHMNEPKLNKKFKDALYGIKHRKKDIEFNAVLDDLIEEYAKIKNDMKR